jgi:hypothetical protein
MSMKNSNDTIGTRSRDLPICSAVLQQLRHRVPLLQKVITLIIAAYYISFKDLLFNIPSSLLSQANLKIR